MLYRHFEETKLAFFSVAGKSEGRKILNLRCNPGEIRVRHVSSMAGSDIFRLLVLSSIWGASFLFMRVAAPSLGPVPLIWLRVGLATVCLSPLLLKKGTWEQCRRNWKELLVLGFFNAAFPFCLLAYATLTLEAGLTAVINAMTPLFTLFVTLIWVRKTPTLWQFAGTGLGLMGVVIFSWDVLSFEKGGGGWAVVAAVCATISYGIGTNFLKIRMPSVSPGVATWGNMCAATILLTPLAFAKWPANAIPSLVWLNVILLAVVSTALAYLLFYRLITKVSALAATSVTFLVPIFAFIWGALFLGETLNFRMSLGIALTLSGTALTLGLFQRKKRTH